MDGIFFLASCIMVGLIQYWLYRNDRAGPTEATDWLFAMRRVKQQKPAEPETRRRHRAAPRPPRRPG